MIPEPRPCSRCKKQIVWSDYIPAYCFACQEAINEKKQNRDAKPTAIVVEKDNDAEKVTDAGIYRFAYYGPIIRLPDEILRRIEITENQNLEVKPTVIVQKEVK